MSEDPANLFFRVDMAKTKSITTDKGKLVNHEELRVLVAHLSAKFTAIEARLDECERTRPVDPAVKEAGDALMADIRSQSGHVQRALMLLPDEPTEVATIVNDGPIPTNDLTGAGLIIGEDGG